MKSIDSSLGIYATFGPGPDLKTSQQYDCQPDQLFLWRKSPNQTQCLSIFKCLSPHSRQTYFGRNQFKLQYQQKNQDIYTNYQNPSPPNFILGDSRQLNQQSNNTKTATTLIPNPVLSTLTTTSTMTLPPFQQFYRNQQGQLYSPLYYFYCSNNNTYYYYYYYIVSVSGSPVNLTAVPQTKISPSALVKPHDATYAAANVQQNELKLDH